MLNKLGNSVKFQK